CQHRPDGQRSRRRHRAPGDQRAAASGTVRALVGHARSLASATLDTGARGAYAGTIRRWRPTASSHWGRVFVLLLATTAGPRVARAWGPGTASQTPVTAAPAPAPVAPPVVAAPANGTAAPTSGADLEGPMQPEAAALYARGLERYTARDYAGAIAD